MTIFDQMMSRYEIISDSDRLNALHETMQEIALAGLYRGGFFEKAAFYGGTCLRIFHSIPRFSEDLDFSLVAKGQTFQIEDYFPAILEEFNAFLTTFYPSIQTGPLFLRNAPPANFTWIFIKSPNCNCLKRAFHPNIFLVPNGIRSPTPCCIPRVVTGNITGTWQQSCGWNNISISAH